MTIIHYNTGFTGRKCEKDPCSSAPCQNGGSCMSMAMNGSTTFHCACADGWTGARCDRSAAGGFCASNPCLNGICVEQTDGDVDGLDYRCFCQPGDCPKTVISKPPLTPKYRWCDCATRRFRAIVKNRKGSFMRHLV